jgi:hypothetical protein
MSSTQPTEHYDPELPILEELETELQRELRTLGLAPVGRSVGGGGLGGPVRVTRRALLLVALVSLVGGSALAGRSVLTRSHSPKPSGPALLAFGRQGPDNWQLEAYLYGGSTCYALFVVDAVSSACGRPPNSTGVRVTSALSATRRFVAGLTGAAVEQVLVHAGGSVLILPTHSLPNTSDGRRAGLRIGLRWFVAILPYDARTRGAPARVTPLDADARPLGQPVLDCSLSAANAICRRAADALAEGVG